MTDQRKIISEIGKNKYNLFIYTCILSFGQIISGIWEVSNDKITAVK
jgi:hypothetical protein